MDIKNDKVDARMLALMCYKQHPSLWQLPPAQMRELINLSRHLGDLVGTRTQQKNRLGEPGNSATVIKSLTAIIDLIDTQIQTVEKSMMDLIDQDPDLREKRDLLVSIPGIGERTALNLMAELPDIEMFGSASAVVRYAGLDPTEHSSGSSVHKKPHIARRGNRHLRAALYMPALSAIQHNAPVREFYLRLLACGKTKMCALVGAMRKLLSIAYGVLHSGQPFNADHRMAASTTI
jgi:transposase